MTPPTTSPDVSKLLTPILSTLPAAAVASEPATGVLPVLSPILRHRVEYLSSSTDGPWLRLLCYDTTKQGRLAEIAQSGRLEPHPVSGDVEVDWEADTATRFRRIDSETLQALVALLSVGLSFRLEYCAEERAQGGDDGWRIAEVTIIEDSAPFVTFLGHATIAEAERDFEINRKPGAANAASVNVANGTNGIHRTTLLPEDDDDDDDDDYWARYDATPARTPAVKRSPAPASMASSTAQLNSVGVNNRLHHSTTSAAEEDDYYAQYDSVQPAMDADEPDGSGGTMEHVDMPPLQPMPSRRTFGLPPVVRDAPTTDSPAVGGANGGFDSAEQMELNETNGAWTLADVPATTYLDEDGDAAGSGTAAIDNDGTDGSGKSDRLAVTDGLLLHPRPASSASSNGSATVARLEHSAGRQEASEFGVKQHVSRSIRSLFLLSRASGIDREEFESMVRTELDLLGLMEDE